MSQKKKSEKNKVYGVNLDFQNTFRFGIVAGALGIIFWGFINILNVWQDHIFLDMLLTGVYLLFILSGLTILIDYYFLKKKE